MRLTPLVCVLSILAPPSAALAQSLGRVVGYNVSQIRTFSKDGRFLGKVETVSLPKDPAITEFGPGGTVGIKDKAGNPIFLRGLDVVTQGADGPCTRIAEATRPANKVYGGANMGLGQGKSKCDPNVR